MKEKEIKAVETISTETLKAEKLRLQQEEQRGLSLLQQTEREVTRI
jgi:hypothetical protein